MNGISHSRLARFLRDVNYNGKALDGEFVKDVIALTAGGVAPEGAKLGRQSFIVPETDFLNQASPALALIGGMRITDKYKLGKASLKELEGVHDPLVDIVKLAIRVTEQDFTVYDGLRTLKEQAAYVKAGNSKTMNSKHLQGLAVDLVPWINGKPVWDWEGCYEIAQAVDAAATHLGIADRITWGGAWDRRLSDFGSAEDWRVYHKETIDYGKRTGKSFLDGPHFEWRT